MNFALGRLRTLRNFTVTRLLPRAPESAHSQAYAGTQNADAVMSKMRELPINDFIATTGKLRIDGRVMREMYLFQVKEPKESKSEWELYKLVASGVSACGRSILSEQCGLL
ncbi:MAG: hypothetical protein LV473_23360 [Nitrospira sp.]|nr:hypothetical protein [Nitrospira sp.]